ncbi:hypothetical protein IQ247_03220 [Plectonema cf. radiosum LEGE 06105]|uniref:Uncharacterized protein n=1 Tax=Plectonema cf. radiosum LEGE 06105 TaxID=945769 RepID=A0A8J7FCH3_9CYAN|nr:hypothetical protein [Plectonema radiosum]MBE9211736.1 hypothetical protein [Plectonema cf. radiosum LEGE 06105]
MNGNSFVQALGILGATGVMMFTLFQRTPMVVKVGTGVLATGAAAVAIANKDKG